MEKLQLYRTALDAVNFLVDFMTKENFYDSELHKKLASWCELVISKLVDDVVSHVSPKVAQ